MAEEPRLDVDAPAARIDPSLQCISRIHRAKRGAPWTYRTAVVVSDPDRIIPALDMCVRASIDTVCVDAEADMAGVLREALRRSRHLMVPDLGLTEVGELFDAGATGVHVEDPHSGDMAALVLASPGAIRYYPASGSLDDLRSLLFETWMEVTAWDGLDCPWTAATLIDTLTGAYGLHEAVGSIPAWRIGELPQSPLSSQARTLAVLGLPGSVTLAEHLVTTLAARAARYRRQYRLDEAPLSYSVRGDLVELISGPFSIYVNTGGAHEQIADRDRIAVTTGARQLAEGTVLDPYSTTWIIHPTR